MKKNDILYPLAIAAVVGIWLETILIEWLIFTLEGDRHFPFRMPFTMLALFCSFIAFIVIAVKLARYPFPKMRGLHILCYYLAGLALSPAAMLAWNRAIEFISEFKRYFGIFYNGVIY